VALGAMKLTDSAVFLNLSGRSRRQMPGKRAVVGNLTPLSG